MSEPAKKRPWFQFHLITAVLVMLGAGVLLGLNLVPRSCAIWVQILPNSHGPVLAVSPSPPGHQMAYTLRGWPLSYEYPEGNLVRALARYRAEYAPEALPASSYAPGVGVFCPPYHYPENEYLVSNSVVGFVLLCIMAAAIERLIRCPEGRGGTVPGDPKTPQ
jgi:hypothetical protein